MIEITDAAAEKLRLSTAEGKVIKIYKTTPPGEVANFAIGLAPPREKDVIFESKGIEVHMNRADAEEMQVAFVDYVDDERGRGFTIYAGQGDICGMVSCEDCEDEIC